MKVYLKEKIGNPDIFTGRKKELAFFLKWIEGVNKEISISTAILSRRKTGKTALMQRLYNLTFEQPDGVIPFYYEVKEGKRWAVEFCKDFFLTFIYQYIAYKSRKPEYVEPPAELKGSFRAAIDIAKEEGLDYLGAEIRGIEAAFNQERVDEIWLMVRDAPRRIATRQHGFIVQMIDEFQYLNSEIYRDKGGTQIIKDFAGGYMSTAEYRNAPLLISGSWVGWLRHLLHTMLPSRFRQEDLEDMPEEETVEMMYKYAQALDVPVNEEVVYAMAKVCEGNPFYVSALFQSSYSGKDFTSREGLLETLEFETLHHRGHIRGVWMEYLSKVFYQVNKREAKRIVLYLSQQRDREVGRAELRKKLGLKTSDVKLEKKLHALVKADIIEEGRTNFDYRGVRDNIFDKVFRGVYQKDIEAFDPKEIRNEYKAMYLKAKHDYQRLLGRFNQTKGLLAEFAIINQLRLHAHQRQEVFTSITHNLPEDFQFVEYEHVWSYKTARPDKQDIWIDIFARAGHEHYSLIAEVKNRTTKSFSRDEAVEFVNKAQTLQAREQVAKAVLFVFSRKGFAKDALSYLQEHGIAYSDDERWLG
ncbi:MAG: hypothetical protein GY801_49515 [bacterium]|nr:hypothetical protein [bacterium]